MADLFDRIDTDPDNEDPSLNVHQLTTAVLLVDSGDFEATAVATFYNMDPAATSDFAALIAFMASRPNVADKLMVLAKLEAGGIAVTEGVVTNKTQYKNIVGIT